MKCKCCGSYAINEHLHGRKKGTDSDLCDVCYWVNRFKEAEITIRKLEFMIENGLGYEDLERDL